jgi:alcohol dehydrogenase class IV
VACGFQSAAQLCRLSRRRKGTYSVGARAELPSGKLIGGAVLIIHVMCFVVVEALNKTKAIARCCLTGQKDKEAIEQDKKQFEE